MSPARARLLLLVNLIAQIGIVVTGGLVRLTGSGLGCPTWPECVPGSYTPVLEQAQGWHKYIEFGNRTLTGAVSLTALGAVLAGWYLMRRGQHPRVFHWALGMLAGVAAQAIIGGITVRTGLNPAIVAAHFLVSMVLVATSAAALDYAGRTAGPQRLTVRPEIRRLTQGLAGLTVVILVLGTLVTGAGPHSGDADAPARLGLDPRQISWLHADAVTLFTGLVIGLVVAVRVTSANPLITRRSLVLLVVTLAQGLIGYVQYATKLPEALVLAHMLGASLLVVAVTRVVSATTASSTVETATHEPSVAGRQR